MTTLSSLPNGIHTGVPFEEYLAYDALSSSALKELRKSPLHFKLAKEFPKKSSESQVLGTLVHAFTFTPEIVNKTYAVLPEGDGRIKAVKDVRALVAEKNPDKILVSQKDFNAAEKMASNVLAHPKLKLWIGEAKKEASLKWSIDDIKCKGRLDAYVEHRGIIIDLKTTESPTTYAFSKSIYQWGYHTQMAWYRRGLKALGLASDHFVLIAIEKTSPYGFKVYELDEDVLDAADKILDQWIDIYDSCTQSNKWPSYSDTIEYIKLPAWASNAEQEF